MVPGWVAVVLCFVPRVGSHKVESQRAKVGKRLNLTGKVKCPYKETKHDHFTLMLVKTAKAEFLYSYRIKTRKRLKKSTFLKIHWEFEEHFKSNQNSTSLSNVKAAGPWPVAADDMAMEAQDMTLVVVLVCSFKKKGKRPNDKRNRDQQRTSFS